MAWPGQLSCALETSTYVAISLRITFACSILFQPDYCPFPVITFCQGKHHVPFEAKRLLDDKQDSRQTDQEKEAVSISVANEEAELDGEDINNRRHNLRPKRPMKFDLHQHERLPTVASRIPKSTMDDFMAAYYLCVKNSLRTALTGMIFLGERGVIWMGKEVYPYTFK